MLLNRKSNAPTPLTLPIPKPGPRPVAPPEPTIQYVEVGPILAASWLETNTGNRNIRQNRVAQYARDMAAGRWTLGADLICFDADDHLLNGQHRLNAVIASGQTITFAVQWNTPTDAMTNMDTGSARTTADVLRWRGELSTTILSSTAKLALLWQTGRIARDTKQQSVSHSEIVEFLEANPGLRHSAHIGDRYRKQVDITPTPLATAHWGIASVNGQETADHFVDRLASLVGEHRGSAVLALHNRLRNIRRDRRLVANRDLLVLVIKAWNVDAKGGTTTSLALPSPSSPFAIPQIARRSKAA